MIGPPGNPIEVLIDELQIGVFCDVNDQASIQNGLKEITANYRYYAEAYDRNSALISRYRADAVAADLLSILDTVYHRSRNEIA